MDYRQHRLDYCQFLVVHEFYQFKKLRIALESEKLGYANLILCGFER
jgi:hypothetical protein